MIAARIRLHYWYWANGFWSSMSEKLWNSEKKGHEQSWLYNECCRAAQRADRWRIVAFHDHHGVHPDDFDSRRHT